MFKENFHTHTKYCDGKNTAEEMIETAINMGFDALGFSGHALISDFCCSWAMTADNTKKYIEEILILKEKYRDKLSIFLGTELDYFSVFNKNDYDYTLGSVHYLKCGDKYYPIDSSAQLQQECADKYFGGSLYKYAEKFFEYEADILKKTDADIIGHFDLVTKFNEGNKLFDVNNKVYKNAWINAADELLTFNKPFEINTGAMARGLRTEPYPSLQMAEYINSKGGYFIVTSDCHYREKLNYAFDEAYDSYSKFRVISFSEFLKSKTSNVLE